MEGLKGEYHPTTTELSFRLFDALDANREDYTCHGVRLFIGCPLHFPIHRVERDSGLFLRSCENERRGRGDLSTADSNFDQDVSPFFLWKDFALDVANATDAILSFLSFERGLSS